MTDLATLSLEHEGRPVEVPVTGFRVYMGGEFAGNVEVDLRCRSELASALVDGLRVQNPGQETSEEAIAHEQIEGGISLSFHCDSVACLAAAPEHLTLLWGKEPAATLAATLCDSVPISQHHSLIDPMQILSSTAISSPSTVRLATGRPLFLLVPAAMVLAFGLALAFASDGLELLTELQKTLGGGVLIACALALAVLAVRPRRQVLLDRERGRLTVVEGKPPSLEGTLSEAPHRQLSEFHHVRLIHREYAPQLGDDDQDGTEEWLVDLEGSIPYACQKGVVHRRSDRLVLGSFQTERGARRFAASVGSQTGLPILAANDGFATE